MRSERASTGMRKCCRGLRFVVLFMSLLVLPAFASEASVTDVSPAAGGIFLATLPSGADVWIDGLYAGHTPLLVDALVAGRHTVTLTRAGWTVLDLEVNVPAGSVVFETFGLTRSPKIRPQNQGTLILRGLPPKAEVSIDGRPYKASLLAPIPLDAGDHSAVIAAEGDKLERRFTVYPETTTLVLGRESVQESAKSTVIAPADTYLPDGSYELTGAHVKIEYGRHHVTGYLGDPTLRIDGVTTTYEVAPSLIGKRLYLPLRFLTEITKEDVP